MAQFKKVLVIFPHPDDETFYCGGLLQRLIRLSIDFKVLILTKGEASTLRYGVGNRDLPEVREQEFKNVCAYLNISDYEILGYKDGGLEQAIDLKQHLVKVIADYAPTDIVTFEPSGIYGHPDHIFISKLLTELAQQFNKHLIYATTYEGHVPSEETLRMAKDPSSVLPIKANIVLKLTILEFIRKVKALKLYESQMGGDTFNIRALFLVFKAKKEYFYSEQGEFLLPEW